MRTKHTQKHADKLAVDRWDSNIARMAYSEGYMKAIEETNVAELLEASEKAAKWIFDNCTGDYENTPWRDLVNAIKKATE